MNPREFANTLKVLDWTACMSDDYRVVKRGEAAYRAAVKVSKETPENARLFELFSTCFSVGANSNSRSENLWRVVGAYLWVNGVAVDEFKCRRLLIDGNRIEFSILDTVISMMDDRN